MFYTTGKLAKLLNISPQTLRRWANSGELKPVRISRGGVRYYTHEQYLRLIHTPPETIGDEDEQEQEQEQQYRPKEAD